MQTDSCNFFCRVLSQLIFKDCFALEGNGRDISLVFNVTVCLLKQLGQNFIVLAGKRLDNHCLFSLADTKT